MRWEQVFPRSPLPAATKKTSPACGGGRRAQRGGWGLSPSERLARGGTPSPTLPRKRERGRTVLGARPNRPQNLDDTPLPPYTSAAPFKGREN